MRSIGSGWRRPRCAATRARLVFDVNGLTLVTMRPSDVPTYVEAGAADLGITGKDVLLEQQGDRIVYEILDLAYGACRMVLAGRQGDPSLGESERRVGGMRIATKYPRIAERHFEETGRHADVIEVKGSVELAPLVGPRRRHRRPGGDRADAAGERPRDPRGDRDLDGAADRQPRLPQAARRRGRRPRGAAAPGERPMRIKPFDWDGAGPASALAAEIRALQPPLGEVSESVAEIIAEVRERRRRAPSPRSRRASATGPSTRIRSAVPDDAVRRRRVAARSRDASPRSRPPRPTSARSRRPSSPRTAAGAETGPDRSSSARSRSASAGDLRAGRHRRLSLDGPDGLHPGEGRRCGAGRRSPRRPAGSSSPSPT